MIGFSIAEDELRHLPVRDMVGDYAAWNYFQSLDSEANREFVRKFKARYGSDRVTSDTIAAAYNSVRLWAQAVAEAETDDVAAVLKAVRKQSIERTGRDHLDRRDDPAYLAAGLHRPDPRRRPVRRRLELGEGGPPDPVPDLAAAGAVGGVPGRAAPVVGRLGQPGPSPGRAGPAPAGAPRRSRPSRHRPKPAKAAAAGGPRSAHRKPPARPGRRSQWAATPPGPASHSSAFTHSTS